MYIDAVVYACWKVPGEIIIELIPRTLHDVCEGRMIGTITTSEIRAGDGKHALGRELTYPGGSILIVLGCCYCGTEEVVESQKTDEVIDADPGPHGAKSGADNTGIHLGGGGLGINFSIDLGGGS